MESVRTDRTWKKKGESLKKHCTAKGKTFKNSANLKGKLFLQDGGPSWETKITWEVGCRLFKIPPCSPDLNPMKNIFHLIGKQLKKDAITQNLEHELIKDLVRELSFEFSTWHYQHDNWINAKN